MLTLQELAVSYNQAGAYVLVIAFLFWVLQSVYSIYLHPLAKFPGPKSAAFSRFPLIYSSVTGQTYKYLEDLHTRYGTTVRISPDELSTISPEAWKDIYLKRPELPKDPLSQTPPLNGSHSLFTARGEAHPRMRRTFLHSFTDKALREQSSLIEGHVSLLLSRLRRVAAKNHEGKVDLSKYLGYAALDIIGDLTFGESYHSLEGDNENSLILAFFLGAKFGNIRNSLANFYPLDRIFGYLFLQLTAKERARNWKNTADKIDRRLEMGHLGDRADFMSSVIGNISEDGSKGIMRKELNTNALAMVIAGCQLPTVALATATYCLLRFPETLRELRNEIRSSFTHENEITIASTQNLPYLAAVINETLRIQHPTPIALPRISPKEGLFVNGEWIPGQTIIGIPLQTIQNSPKHFFEPRIFHPERFLQHEDSRYDKKFDNDDLTAFRPFSIGSRNCIGGKVFLAEARIILAMMMWNFDLNLVDEDDWEWMDQRAYLVFEPKSLMVQLKEKA